MKNLKLLYGKEDESVWQEMEVNDSKKRRYRRFRKAKLEHRCRLNKRNIKFHSNWEEC